MGILNILDVKAGMELEQAIISPENGQCLLKAGSILNLRNIEKLKELNITQVGIKDRNSIFVSPFDKMQKMLILFLHRFLTENIKVWTLLLHKFK